MKLKNLLYLLLIPALSLSMISCDDEEFPKTIETKQLLVDGEEPKMTFFFLPLEDSVYIINSDEELFALRNPYLDWEDRIYSSNVNYQTHSVLLVGSSSQGLFEPDKGVYIQTGEHTFEVRISARQDYEMVQVSWNQRFVVPKVSKDAIITAKVTKVLPDWDL